MIPRAALAAASALAVLGVGASTAAAAATDWRPVPESGAPGHLVLETGPSPLVLPAPGTADPVHWQVRTRVEESGPVVLDVELRKDGRAAREPSGLVVSVASCDEEWRDRPSGEPTCGTGGTVLLTGTPADDWAARSPVVRIPDGDRDGTVHLLVTIGAEEPTDPALVGTPGRVGVGVTARSVDGDPSGNREEPRVLAFTGVRLVGPVLLALAAIVAGAALRPRRGALP